MDKSEVIFLISSAYTKNDNGVFETVEAKKQVFCSADSASQSEFFNGGLNGLKPQKKIHVV